MQWSRLSRFRSRTSCACLCLLLFPLTFSAAAGTKQASDDKRQAFSLLASATGIEIGDDAAAAYGCERIAALTAPVAARLPGRKPDKPAVFPSTNHATGAASSLDACLRRAMQIQDVETRQRAALEIGAQFLSAYPERALEGIALVDASVQPPLRAKYVDYLVSQKRLKEAHEQVFLMPRDEHFSFEAAIHLMMATSGRDTSERRAIYALATDAFRNIPSQSGSLIPSGNDDFGGLIVHFWKEMPTEQVLDSIELLLQKAKEQQEGQEGRNWSPRITTSSSGRGSRSEATFNSVYEFRVFEVLPILRQIDPARYDEYVKENTDVRQELERLPDGLASMDPWYGKTTGETQRTNFVSLGLPPTVPAAVLNQISGAQTPQDALREAMSLPAVSADGESPRLEALQVLVDGGSSRNPGVTVEALHEMETNLGQLDDIRKLGYEIEIVKYYLKLQLNSDADRILLGEFSKLQSDLLRRDTDNGDPNRASKLFWPSTAAARAIACLEAKIDARKAIEFANGSLDPDLKATLYIDIAEVLLGKKPARLHLERRFNELRAYQVSSTDLQVGE